MKRFSAETQCTGKRRFSSRKLAKRHLRLVQGVGIRAAVHDMTEYQCPHCGWWHVGGRLRSPSSSVRA